MSRQRPSIHWRLLLLIALEVGVFSFTGANFFTAGNVSCAVAILLLAAVLPRWLALAPTPRRPAA